MYPVSIAILSPFWPLRFSVRYPDTSSAANENISRPYFQRQSLVGLRQSINSISLTLNVDWVVSNSSCPARVNLWILLWTLGKKCSLTILRLYFFNFYMYGCVCMYTMTVQHWIPGSWSYKQLWVSWVLGTKLRSSWRAGSTLNPWAFPPVPLSFFFWWCKHEIVAIFSPAGKSAFRPSWYHEATGKAKSVMISEVLDQLSFVLAVDGTCKIPLFSSLMVCGDHVCLWAHMWPESDGWCLLL